MLSASEMHHHIIITWLKTLPSAAVFQLPLTAIGYQILTSVYLSTERQYRCAEVGRRDSSLQDAEHQFASNMGLDGKGFACMVKRSAVFIVTVSHVAAVSCRIPTQHRMSIAA